jgi:mannosyltransferase OCH1-like enzyme
MKKAVFAIFFLVIIIVSIKHRERVRGYLAEEKYYKILEKVHIIKRCYQPMQDFKEVFLQEGFDYKALDEQVTADGLVKLAHMKNSLDYKIPTITHHIYFTSNSKILNDFYLEKMKANFSKLNAVSGNWQHYIWTNKQEIFLDELRDIPGVMVREVLELKEHILYPSVLEALNKGQVSRAYFAEASDILRFILVQKFGGVYHDMDYEIYNAEALSNMMKNFDFIGGRELYKEESYYGSAFFAAKANHPVLNDVVEKKHRNSMIMNAPNYIKYPCYSNDLVYFNSPPLLTLAYFNKNNIEGNEDIILPAWMVFNVDFARYKNKTCHYSLITRDEFKRNNKNLSALVAGYTNHLTIIDNAENIYYKNNTEFPIIGADMFCGNWYDNKNNYKNKYHWIWE